MGVVRQARPGLGEYGRGSVIFGIIGIATASWSVLGCEVWQMKV